jgi:phosphonate transport system permease protein
MSWSSLVEFETVTRSKRARELVSVTAAAVVFIALLAVSARIGEVSPQALLDGSSAAADYIGRMMPSLHLNTVGSDLRTWYWSAGTWLNALSDTVLIAFLSTVIGFVIGAPLSFVASRNLTSGWAYFAVRRSLELIRTVPSLVYAMAFVLAFGLGATAGVLAVALHSASSLGKLFSEVNETADSKTFEAVQSAGGGWLSVVRFALLPQVAPAYVSYTLLRFEKNIRSATVIGLVGAGGIGQELFVAIRSFQYQDVSAIVLMIICTVTVVDMTCDHARRLFT